MNFLLSDEMEYAKYVFYLVLVGFLWRGVATGLMLAKGSTPTNSE